MKDWSYNEFLQVGIDYSKKSVVDGYDDDMESFRDYAAEAKQFLDKLKVSNAKELTVIDLGCGTGAFPLHAAKYFKQILAVDVSQEMLNIASAKVNARQIKNVDFFHSGFLQFQPENRADIAHTKWAFHHLPDYWKQAGLLNMNKMLKMGGTLFLADLVFQFDSNYEANTDLLINDLSNEFSEAFIAELKVHIRDEYSTFDWILQGLIERAGFSIESINIESSLVSEYFCKKVMDI